MKPKETYAISITKPKIAALIYDRVWTGLGNLDVPTSIAFNAFDEFAKDAQNIGVFTTGDGLGIYDNKTGETVSNPGVLGFIAAQNLISFEKAKAKEKLYHPIFDEDIRSRAEITFRTLLSFQYDIEAIPVFESRASHDRAYTPGSNEVIISILENMPLVDDTKLEWEQVMEFRNDEEARKLFLRLKHWLDKDMVGKSEQFIADEINLRLERYEWAIKKHGFQTVTGVLSTVIDYRTLLAGLGTSAVAASFVDLLLAISAGGGIILGGVAIKLANSLINLKDVKFGPDSEVSFIHEVKSKLGK